MKNPIFLVLILCSLMVSQTAESKGTEIYVNCLGERGSQKKVSRYACHSKNLYEIRYAPKGKEVVLRYAGKKLILSRISKPFDPVLVGSDSIIGFLADELQVYKSKHVLMYFSAVRTSGGSGGGQCGAGSEIFLNFLNVANKVPKTLSRILVISCEEDIEVDEQDVARGDPGDFSVHDGVLQIKFLNYKNSETQSVATISTDFKSLVFN